MTLAGIVPVESRKYAEPGKKAHLGAYNLIKDVSGKNKRKKNYHGSIESEKIDEKLLTKDAKMIIKETEDEFGRYVKSNLTSLEEDTLEESSLISITIFINNSLKKKDH
jgi:hypothetical protein